MNHSKRDSEPEVVGPFVLPCHENVQTKPVRQAKAFDATQTQDPSLKSGIEVGPRQQHPTMQLGEGSIILIRQHFTVSSTIFTSP